MLPTNDDIDKTVQELFANVDLNLIEIAFSIESARSALLKTIMKLPPSDRSQQFKDGVLWADCCGLLDEDDVCFVTSDTDFYEERNYKKGLAANLREETSDRKCDLRIFSSLTDLLVDIKKEIVIDVDSLAIKFIETNKINIEGILSRNDFEMGDRVGISKALYATERSDSLYLEFDIEFSCDDLTNDGRTDAGLILKGDGSYNIADNSFTDLRSRGEELSFRLRDGGDRVVRNHVLLAGHLVVGHREVVHTVRPKLD